MNIRVMYTIMRKTLNLVTNGRKNYKVNSKNGLKR